MSHQPDTEPKTCPNCGFPATHNYCAQCGQETHLHKDTFFGLIWHFIGHYFHYDSKFWKTLKALWFSPGKLTKAYFDGKRARYIPPISLYIFVSAVFFLATFLTPAYNHKAPKAGLHISASQMPDTPDSTYQLAEHVPLTTDSPARSGISGGLRRTSQILQEMDDGQREDLVDAFLHQMPRVFFFLIPFMAFVLTLLFLRRKECGFAQHAIFSLHIHSFFFSLFLINVLLPLDELETQLIVLLSAVFGLYFIVAMKRTYGLSIGRAIRNSIVVGISYFAVMLLTIVILIVSMARSGAH